MDEMLPTYPIMIGAIAGDGPDYLMKCSCGQLFGVDWGTGENFVSLGNSQREVCPNCHGMSGMTAKQHAEAIVEIKLWLCALRGSERMKVPAAIAWTHSQQAWMEALLENAALCAVEDHETALTVDEIESFMAAITVHNRKGSPPMNLDGAQVAWEDMGPFPMYPEAVEISPPLERIEVNQMKLTPPEDDGPTVA